MQILRTITTISAIATAITLSTGAFAKVSQKEADKLGTELNPLGGSMKGNAAGTIPDWTGAPKIPSGYKKGQPYIDPYADEKPLFTIDGSNYKKYEKNLSVGQVAMFEKFPKTFKMLVYPTHRTADFPDHVKKGIKVNAVNAELKKNNDHVVNAKFAIPFPIPQTPYEIIWNHFLGYRPAGTTDYVSSAYVTTNGQKNISTSRWTVHDFFAAGIEGDLSIAVLIEYLTPARIAGGVILVHDGYDRSKGRQAWTYNPGQRRVRRAPGIEFDGPVTGAGGSIVADDVVMFNGSMARFSFELVGQREMYVPYNAFKMTTKAATADKFLTKGHPDPSVKRYELHRVWVLEGKLKEGASHIYSKRTLFADEDGFQILLSESYDQSGKLWRFNENHVVLYYDVPTTGTAGQIYHDVQNGKYYVARMFADTEPPQFSEKGKPMQFFTPSALRSLGRR